MTREVSLTKVMGWRLNEDGLLEVRYRRQDFQVFVRMITDPDALFNRTKYGLFTDIRYDDFGSIHIAHEPENPNTYNWWIAPMGCNNGIEAKRLYYKELEAQHNGTPNVRLKASIYTIKEKYLLSEAVSLEEYFRTDLNVFYNHPLKIPNLLLQAMHDQVVLVAYNEAIEFLGTFIDKYQKYVV